MDQIVQTGRTVEEAEEQALAALGVDRSEVEVEILNRGRQGFLGIGGELAEVRVTRLGGGGEDDPEDAADSDDAVDEQADAEYEEPERDDAEYEEPERDDDEYEEPERDDDEYEERERAPIPPISADTPAGAAVQAVERILESVGAEVEVTLRSDHDEFTGGPVIDINGPDSGLLIGRRGNTLQSLQFIVQSIVRQQFEQDGIRVALDVEQYRQRREDSLREMADRVANRVLETGRSITLEPMPPSDRRVIHVFLDSKDGIRTESVGFGEGRKVQIILDRD